MDVVGELAEQHRPKLIVVGATAYPRQFDFKQWRAIADSVNAYLLADIAHIAGLIAAGVHPDPAPHCDVITTTTHKTLRGPRGAMVMCRQEFAEAVDRAVFPGLQGGPFMHAIAAKAVAFKEAMQPAFREYQAHVVGECAGDGRNAQVERTSSDHRGDGESLDVNRPEHLV